MDWSEECSLKTSYKFEAYQVLGRIINLEAIAGASNNPSSWALYTTANCEQTSNEQPVSTSPTSHHAKVNKHHFGYEQGSFSSSLSAAISIPHQSIRTSKTPFTLAQNDIIEIKDLSLLASESKDRPRMFSSIRRDFEIKPSNRVF